MVPRDGLFTIVAAHNNSIVEARPLLVTHPFAKRAITSVLLLQSYSAIVSQNRKSFKSEDCLKPFRHMLPNYFLCRSPCLLLSRAFANMVTHQLLPPLPPELRNLVYSHTILHSNPATCIGLPFESKIYDSKHTTIQIIPIHHGNPTLLAVQNNHFLECAEYNNWLLTNAVELRIGILFKGDINTFSQEHWGKKTTAHLAKLIKKNSWVKKVTDYDIQILWEPSCWLKTRHRKKRLGAVAYAMVDTLTSAMEPDLKRKRGHVKVVLHMSNFVTRDSVNGGQFLGLNEFLSSAKANIVKSQICEIRIAPDHMKFNQQEMDATAAQNLLPPHLKAFPQPGAVQGLLVAEKGIVEWGFWTKGCLVMGREIEDENGVAKMVMGGGDGVPEHATAVPEWLLSRLLEECMRPVGK